MKVNLKRRAHSLSRIVLLLLAREHLAGAAITQASRGARHLSLGVKLTDSAELDKALKLSEAVALASNSDNVLAYRQAGLIIYQFQLAPGYWESYTRADLPMAKAVGLAEQRRPIAFQLDPPHALVAGTTGSGKSETIKSILLSLMTTYTPDELTLVLIDPNRDYTDLTNVAHLAMPLAHDADSIRVALAWANRELIKRIDNNFRRDRVLIVAMDEAEAGHVLGDRVNLEFALNIARQGRKYRVHLLVATKRPTQKDFPGLIDQLLNRFVGLVSSANESAILTGHAGLNAHKLTGKGDFLHITGPMHDRFQVAIATHQDFASLPRAEIKPIFSEYTSEVISLPDEKPSGGRPSLEVDPTMAARYFWHNPNAISISMAYEHFGLTRTGHNLHKNFTLEFAAELNRLRAAKRGV